MASATATAGENAYLSQEWEKVEKIVWLSAVGLEMERSCNRLPGKEGKTEERSIQIVHVAMRGCNMRSS